MQVQTIQKIQSIENAAELLSIEPDRTRYEFSNFIKVEKFGERRIAKRRLQLLKTIEPIIEDATSPQDSIFFVTEGLKVSIFEQLFLGRVTQYYNRTAFVFTPDRIMLIHIKSAKAIGNFIGAIDYSSIKKVTSKFTGSFRLNLLNGKTLIFSSIPKSDRVYLRDLLNSVVDTEAPKDKSMPGVVKLCPNCFEDVLDHPKSCPSCNQNFKQPKLAAFFSLLMPGLGDLYLGHKILGTMELGVMLWIWSGFVRAIIDAQTQSGDLLGASIAAVILFVLVHPIDAIKCHYLAKKGLMAAKTSDEEYRAFETGNA